MWAIEDMHVTTGEPETPEDPHKKEAVREAEAASQFMFSRKYAFDNQVIYYNDKLEILNYC